jgi:single-strand DNA-binding protein
MATDLNKVVLIGRLTRDAELRYSNTGTPICRFSLGNTYRTKSGDQWVEESNFFDAVLFGRRAEALNRYMTKGTQLGIEGELRQRRWQQDDGQNRSKIEIHVSDVQLLGGGSGQGGSSGQAQGQGGAQSAPYSEPSGFNSGESESFEDDVPF